MINQIINDISTLHKPITKQLRTLAKSYKKALSHKDIPTIFDLCEQLLQYETFQYSTVAYQILWDQSKRFEKHHFDLLNHIVITYIRDWWDCDDVFTHAFGNYFLQYPDMIPNTVPWTTHDSFGVRRSAAVCLIVLARKKAISFTPIETICDLLHNDSHYLVLKGYGWLLKEASIHYHDDVVAYLKKHVSTMPRTAFRYALEKLPEQERQTFMSL